MSWVDGLGFCASFGSCQLLHDHDRIAPDVRAGEQCLVQHVWSDRAHPVVFPHMILLPINLLKLYRLQNRKPAQA
jgi:hypothetical protein